jgi:hypothetical protein
MMALMTIACSVLLLVTFYCKLPLYTLISNSTKNTIWATKAAYRLG